MTNEEFEKRMVFLLEQQAQFSADMQQLGEAQAQTVEIVGLLANGTLEGFREVNTKIDVLVDSQIRTDERINALAADMRNLIAVVDRYFTEGRNGN